MLTYNISKEILFHKELKCHELSNNMWGKSVNKGLTDAQHDAFPPEKPPALNCDCELIALETLFPLALN